MLFQTPEFVALMLVVMAGLCYWRTLRPQHVLLIVASYVFYAWLDVRFLILLLLSSCIDFMGALGIAGTKLSGRERLRLSAWVMIGAYVCLGWNWPLLQASDAPPDWSWSEFFTPGMSWELFALAFGACVLFAIGWPLLYEWFFRFSENRRRNAFLWASMTANLGMLALFKYGDFFLSSYADLMHWFGYEHVPYRLGLKLPPGISFYTFVTMSYGIDAWRREIVPERSFLRMALFVSYFPHLVAGPVIRPEQLLPNLHSPWTLRADRMLSGLHLSLVGLFKKIFIADWVANMVAALLANHGRLAEMPTLGVWLGSLFFAVQIYCDFSGYTDMARGVSRILGVELPPNFNYPYFSLSIADFWHRWHISLSTWLRDYLYIPLGGGRRSPPRVYLNLFITMLLGGLWHGASWNFVLWGAYHGVLLALHRLWSGYTKDIRVIQRVLTSTPGLVFCWMLTTYFTLCGWLIFYLQHLPLFDWDADSTISLMGVLRKFVIPDGDWNLSNLGIGTGSPGAAFAALFVFAIFHTWSYFGGRWSDAFDRWSMPARFALYFVLGFVFYYGWPATESSFIYFQF